MSIVYRFRILLIRIGKVLPFVICGLVFISYSECVYALLNCDFVIWEGYAIPNKPISWWISSYFEYNIQTLIILAVLSIGLETCIYNKCAVAYLGINLFERSYLISFELQEETIYAICTVNILISAYLVYRGIAIYFLKKP